MHNGGLKGIVWNKSQQNIYIQINVYVCYVSFVYVLCIQFEVFFHLPMGETTVLFDAK